MENKTEGLCSVCRLVLVLDGRLLPTHYVNAIIDNGICPGSKRFPQKLVVNNELVDNTDAS